MRILVLTNRVPYPLHDGGNLAVNNMLEGLLLQGTRVSLLSMNTSRHRVSPEQFPALFTQLEQIETVNIDNRVKPLAALSHLIRGKSYNIARFISTDYKEALMRMLRQHSYDAILMEGLFVTPYIPVIRRYSKAVLCYRQHNVEFEIWDRLARTTANPLKKWYVQHLAEALKQYEIKHLNDYDLIAAISPVDADHYRDLGCTIPIETIPYALSAAQIREQDQVPVPLSLYHIGAMDWQPNVDGMLWFLEQVWPLVLQKVPDARLHLAGRNMPDSFYNSRWPQVSIAGMVPDAHAFEEDKSILIVPIHSGGGIRVKILQSMAKGKAVITTSVGLQGIESARNGEEVFVADSPEAFADQCIALLSNPEQVAAIGHKAFQLIRTYYDLSKVSARLVHILRQYALSEAP